MYQINNKKVFKVYIWWIQEYNNKIKIRAK